MIRLRVALLLVGMSMSCAHRRSADRANANSSSEHRVEPDVALPVSAPPGDDAAASRDVHALTLRDVDWCNRSYGDRIPPLYQCQGSVGVAHRRGEGDHSTRYVRFVSATYGDLDGDGREEALVVIESVDRPLLIQPTQPPTEHLVAVFTLRGADLYLYPVTTAGDADITGVRIDRGEALLSRRVSSRECTERWRVVGEEFRRVADAGC